MMTPCKFLNWSHEVLYKRSRRKKEEKVITQSEFNVIYEFLNRVPLTGHNERSAMNSVIVKLQNITEPDKRRKEDRTKQTED